MTERPAGYGPLVPGEQHLVLLREAIALEADAHRALLAGDEVAARDGLRAASDRYRASWDAAPPDAYGRLVGMVKAAVLAGEAATAARFVRAAVPEPPPSPTSAYALAVAALVAGDTEVAERAAEVMRGGSAAFGRAADAVAALAGGDASAYAATVEAIVADFAEREDHLTGVAIADTALMLERLAGGRGMAASPASPLMPPLPAP